MIEIVGRVDMSGFVRCEIRVKGEGEKVGLRGERLSEGGVKMVRNKIR